MADIEHPLAVYFDEFTGKRQTIFAEKLRNDEVLAQARRLELYDGSEQVRVAPKFSSKGRPFFCATTTGRRRIFDYETDPAHGKRVKELIEALNSLEAWSLALMNRDKIEGKSDEIAYEEVIKLPKYQWRTEVHRILTEDSIVRHDIFGQSEELGMSVRRPWIAIEVINTHFPEAAAFSALLETSKRMPLIVLFDFTAFPNAFVKVEKGQNILHYRPWAYFIRDGCVWKGKAQTGIDSAEKFQIEVGAMLKRWEKR